MEQARNLIAKKINFREYFNALNGNWNFLTLAASLYSDRNNFKCGITELRK